MIASLPDDVLRIIGEYSKNQDWKCLMDTSNECFRDLKSRMIVAFVHFNMLNDRVLPLVASELMNPLQQLYLYLDTEESIEWPDDDDVVTGVSTKRSWEHPVKWRSNNLVTLKDIKWFLSIPAKSLYWYRGDLLLSENPILIKALRKYESLNLQITFRQEFIYEVDHPQLHYLNYSNHIKYLTICGSLDFKAPILPSLIELELESMTGEVDLTNLIYSLLLEDITFNLCTQSTVLIPSQLIEEGVEIYYSDCYNVVEVKVEMSTNSEIRNNDKNYEIPKNSDNNDNNDDGMNIYDEDEVTVYSSEDDEEDEKDGSN